MERWTGLGTLSCFALRVACSTGSAPPEPPSIEAPGREGDALRVEGGHIGYDTVPSFRGRGVATEMLRQALPVARALGLTELLLTCDDTNAASIRVIERNGGALRETKALDPSRLVKRYYWIATGGTEE